MGRLIDENSVIENADKCTFTDENERRKFLQFVKYCVEQSETAYDVDKVVTELEEVKYYSEDGVHEVVGYGRAIGIINQLAEEYNNGWIPCSERLPEEYGEYLCCDKYGEYIIGYPVARVSSDDYYVETSQEIMNDCIAWQPLPAPYKEGE